ncbi:MAG: ABC transporter ATP-binding protein [Pseudomonadota bacterium]
MLEVTDLSVRAGTFVLSQVSLKVLPSSCHVILGPTGSGKTLLMESVIGLRNPQTGKVILEGKNITCLPMEQRGLSYVPQDLALFPHMTVRQNILYPIRIRGGKQNFEKGIVRELIDSLSIGYLLDRSVKNLSGGERQRTALARAVASGCKYLVLDEPLSALHESLKTELWYLLKDLQKRYELAILMVTHDLEEAFFLGDVISVIIDGKLRQQGGKRDVYKFPYREDVARFLGVQNLFRARIERINEYSWIAICEDLGVSLSLSTQWSKLATKNNNDFILGIRPQDVAVSTDGKSISDSSNILEGTIIAIFESGASWKVIIACGNRPEKVELVMHCSASTGLKIVAGQKILIHLPKENLFLIEPA